MDTTQHHRRERERPPPAAAPDDGVQGRPVPVQQVFERVSARLLDAHPGDERGRMLHSAGVKTAGRFYAFATQNDVVVKLPAARVTELIASGVGRACDPRGGRPMRQWVRITPADEQDCTAYLIEARDFVARHANQQPAGRTTTGTGRRSLTRREEPS